MTRRLFITGTDTEVGKTYVSSLLLQQFKQQGLSTLAVKPIAAGCQWTPQGYRNDDALQLQQQMTVKLRYEQVNPIALPPAIAPHIALQHSGQCFDLTAMLTHIDSLQQQYQPDILLIEGAGGWQVPLALSPKPLTLSDFALQLGGEVILVVGLRLGCLNHALLTAEAIIRSGAPFAGWIANCLHADMPYLSDNLHSLQQLIHQPCLAQVAYQGGLIQPSCHRLNSVLSVP